MEMLHNISGFASILCWLCVTVGYNLHICIWSCDFWDSSEITKENTCAKQPIIQMNCGYLTVQLFRLLFSSVESSVIKDHLCVHHIKSERVVFFPFAFVYVEEKQALGEQWSLVPDLGAMHSLCLCSESHYLMSCINCLRKKTWGQWIFKSC